MRKPANVGELKERLFSATDGGVACEAINLLADRAQKGSEEAKTELGNYAKDGPIPHMRAHACSRLASAIKEPDAGFAELFRVGLVESRIRYWSILGYIRSAGKGAYEELIQIAENDKIPLEERAHAIKCLARFSRQRFDRGLPSDPGFWEEKHLRLAELRAWAASGYADGVEYSTPSRHATLDNPQNEFERSVQKLDKKLAQERKKRQHPAAPTNWLVIADGQDISRIKAQWDLPSTYLDFLTRFSPLRMNITNRRFFNSLSLFGAGELLEAQNGYSYNPIENQPTLGWPTHLVVIASHGGDPYVLDLSRSDGSDAPIRSAEHGTGAWKFKKAADSFAMFIDRLAK